MKVIAFLGYITTLGRDEAAQWSNPLLTRY